MEARVSIEEENTAFFLVMLIASIALTIIGRLLSPHPVGPQPSALGEFSVPTAEEGRAIAVVFGTCKIQGGNTVWWGDLKSSPVKVGGGILEFGMTTITGYNYFLGVQMMLCHGPVDLLAAIEMDKKDVPYTSAMIPNGDGSENYLKLIATGQNLFGGTKAGGLGGFSGEIHFYRGLLTQQPDPYLSAKQGRVTLDQSGIGYEFSGVGNGTIVDESGGSSSLDETITITAYGIDGNNTHSTYQKMEFHVVGSRSGAQANATENGDGSRGCWADEAFSCPVINFTIRTGSIQFQIGDQFTIITQHSQIASAYRGKCYAVFCQTYMGTSNYMKPPAFIVQRCPDPLSQGAGIANIAGDANPALAVYELLTNADFGLGLPTATMNAASFEAAAATLAAEGLGISMQIDVQGTADQLIGEILRHCDGLLYTDPATGLWTIVLARGGYDATTLAVLTVDNVLATPDFSRGSWNETTNKVSIKYVNRSADFVDGMITGYDPANIAVTGEVRPETIEFKGISNAAAAALVCIRCLKVFTYPLSKIKIIANRAAWAFRPGGLFRFTWVPLGIVNQIFRITRIGYGSLTDGKITIEAVEDIFGINSVAFVPPPASGWVNPIGIPLTNAYQQLVEMPLAIGENQVPPLTGIGAMAMAVRNPATAAKVFEIWEDAGSLGFIDTGDQGSFCPVGFLTAEYRAGTAAIDLAGFTLDGNGIDLVALVSVSQTDELESALNLCLIDGEIMGWTAANANSDGTTTISGIVRGLWDTVPADHAEGASVWFFSMGLGTSNGLMLGTTDGTVGAKLVPQNSAGSTPIASVTEVSLTTSTRAGRPYPPGNLRMQGLAYGTRYKKIVGDLTLTWSARNYETPAVPLVTQDETGLFHLPSEVGYEVQTKIAGTAVLSPVDTGDGDTSTVTITAAQRRSCAGAGDAPLTVEVFTFLNSYPAAALYSFQPQRVDVIFTGFGMCFGEFFGGVNQ